MSIINARVRRKGSGKSTREGAREKKPRQWDQDVGGLFAAE
jgi:hypothetical protein